MEQIVAYLFGMFVVAAITGGLCYASGYGKGFTKGRATGITEAQGLYDEREHDLKVATAAIRETANHLENRAEEFADALLENHTIGGEYRSPGSNRHLGIDDLSHSGYRGSLNGDNYLDARDAEDMTDEDFEEAEASGDADNIDDA